MRSEGETRYEDVWSFRWLRVALPDRSGARGRTAELLDEDPRKELPFSGVYSVRDGKLEPEEEGRDAV